MKMYTHYRVPILTGLLSVTSLSACVTTRPCLGMDHPEQQNTTVQTSSAILVPTSEDAGSTVAHAMVLDEQILADLEQHNFSIDRIKYWLAKGLNIDAQDGAGLTILIGSIFRNVHKGEKFILPIVEFLIANKVDVNAQTKEGITALMKAAQELYEDVVRALLAADADPRMRLKATEIGVLPPSVIRLKEGMTARDFVQITDCEEEEEEEKAKKARIIAALGTAAEKLDGPVQPTVAT